jgi:hypothetical protein
MSIEQFFSKIILSYVTVLALTTIIVHTHVNQITQTTLNDASHLNQIVANILNHTSWHYIPNNKYFKLSSHLN